MPEDTGQLGSSLPPEIGWHTPLCSDSWGSFPSATPL